MTLEYRGVTVDQWKEARAAICRAGRIAREEGFHPESEAVANSYRWAIEGKSGLPWGIFDRKMRQHLRELEAEAS